MVKFAKFSSSSEEIKSVDRLQYRAIRLRMEKYTCKLLFILNITTYVFMSIVNEEGKVGIYLQSIFDARRILSRFSRSVIIDYQKGRKN